MRLLYTICDLVSVERCDIRITDAPTAEARMLALVEWYLLSFHAGRQVIRITVMLSRCRSVWFSGHFPGGPVLAGSIMPNDVGSGGDNCSYNM